jgi:hypothetical protein
MGHLRQARVLPRVRADMLVLELPFFAVVRLRLTATTGAATTRPPLHVARRPRATSVSDTSAYGCVPSPRSFPTTSPRPPTTSLAGEWPAGKPPAASPISGAVGGNESRLSPSLSLGV